MVSYTAAFGYQKVGLSTADNKVFTANKTLGSEVFGLAKVSGEISKVSYLDKTTQFTYTEDKKDKKDKTEEVTGVDAGFENIGYEGYVWTVPGAKKTVAAVSTVYVTGESSATPPTAPLMVSWSTRTTMLTSLTRPIASTITACSLAASSPTPLPRSTILA